MKLFIKNNFHSNHHYFHYLVLHQKINYSNLYFIMHLWYKKVEFYQNTINWVLLMRIPKNNTAKATVAGHRRHVMPIVPIVEERTSSVEHLPPHFTLSKTLLHEGNLFYFTFWKRDNRFFLKTSSKYLFCYSPRIWMRNLIRIAIIFPLLWIVIF